MAKDPQAVLQAYQTGVQAGGTKYATGVKAAAPDWEANAKSNNAEAAYAAGVQRAVEQKARQKALANVSGSQWAAAASEQGARNYSGAAQRAAAKYQTQLGDILAAGDEAKTAANQIPRGSIAQNFDRSRAAGTAVHRHWARKKGVEPEV